MMSRPKKLFQELNDDARGCRSLEECWCQINAQLTPGFGLEIATVSLEGKRYHAIVDQNHDEISKKSFPSLNPHQKAFIVAVLKKLVDGGDNGVSRMDLVNLRSEIQDPFRILKVEEAELCLDDLLDEHWLMIHENQDRRNSMAQRYCLGPRTFLELSNLLKDFGMEDLPQFIFHRT
mmetsp:Transcript_33765/g.77897  ORF Transcript_33765/g.77897 Transcript_33765/m.77897 type:complete len:177 (+) Transcript_33765:1-531(+)